MLFESHCDVYLCLSLSRCNATAHKVCCDELLLKGGAVIALPLLSLFQVFVIHLLCSMAFQNSNHVDASRSTFNDVRDQINIGRDHIIFNFSDLSSESISSSSGVRSAPATTFSSRRRRRRPDGYSSDDSERYYAPFETNPVGGREDTRRKRIDEEQKKRDELKDNYQKLKDELPPSDHFKSNKVTLLLRGKFHLIIPRDQLRADLNPQPLPTSASSRLH